MQTLTSTDTVLFKFEQDISDDSVNCGSLEYRSTMLQQKLRTVCKRYTRGLCAGENKLFIYDFERRKITKSVKTTELYDTVYAAENGKVIAVSDNIIIFDLEKSESETLPTSDELCIYAMNELKDGRWICDSSNRIDIFSLEEKTLSTFKEFEENAFMDFPSLILHNETVLLFMSPYVIQVWDNPIKQCLFEVQLSRDDMQYAMLLELYNYQILGLRMDGDVDLINLNTGLVTCFYKPEDDECDSMILLSSGNIAILMDSGDIVILDSSGNTVRVFQGITKVDRGVEAEIHELEPGIIVCEAHYKVCYLYEKTGHVQMSDQVEIRAIYRLLPSFI